MKNRIIVGIIGIPLLIILIILGGWYLFGLVFVLSNICIWELINIFSKKGATPIKSLSYIWNSIFIISIFLILFYGGNYSGIPAMGILIVLLLLNSLLHFGINLWNKAPNNTINISTGITNFSYITLFFSSVICISLFNEFGEIFLNLNLLSLIQINEINWNYVLLSMFISIWSSDTFAYFIGRKIGKHKLFERISPKKSWEGAIAGFVGAVVGFTIPIYYLTPNFNFILSIIIGIVIGIVGPIGDLAESQLKRDAGIKDSSNLIPGHGGLLDRFDSMLFAAPSILIVLIIYFYFSN